MFQQELLSVYITCTLCTSFSLAMVKGLHMIIYFIIEDLLKHYLQKNFHSPSASFLIGCLMTVFHFSGATFLASDI